jgi:transposase-like protein
MARGRYDDTDKARVLAVLQANDGNVKRTARETGVADQTVRDWKKKLAKGQMPAGTTAALPAMLGEFVADAERIRNKALKELEVQIDAGELSGKDLIVIVGVLTDKVRMAKGQATARTEHVAKGPTPEEFAPVFADYLNRSFEAAERREIDIELPDSEVEEQAAPVALLSVES